jgi:NADH:ubiquinone oxidoreductase subunit 5 (subunit L)/multisubunit Na+/H+ antiporter MnhA subunit
MDSPQIISVLPGIAALAGMVARMGGATALRLVTASVWSVFGLFAAVAALAAAGQIEAGSLALALGLLTAFVGGIVLSFSRRHMKADPRLAIYAQRIGLLITAVLVSVTAHDLISFAVAWIASGWLLARLIGHVPGWVEAEAAETRARRAFLIGDTALVAALGLLAYEAGALSIDAALAAAKSLPVAAQVATGLLLLVAAIARSAVPPFHKWLMGSMTAPTPVSALMHAGLVNAGGFLLIRFGELISAAPGVSLAAVAIGAVGALFGTGVMIVRPDVKRALGGSTVAQMSFMIMTCGLGAYAAALWHLIAHGLFKAWSFLGAGGTIGRAKPSTLTRPGAADAVMVTAAAGALVAVLAGRGVIGADALPLPIVFAAVTGLASLAGLTRASTKGAAPAAVIAVSTGFALAYVGGVTLIESLPGLPAASAPLSTPAQLALLAPFVAAWIWQLARRPLPAALYIRMLNTGGPALIR